MEISLPGWKRRQKRTEAGKNERLTFVTGAEPSRVFPALRGLQLFDAVTQ